MATLFCFYGGVLKSVHKASDDKQTYVTLVESSNYACVKVLKNNAKIKTYSNLTDKKTITYKDENEMEKVQEL